MLFWELFGAKQSATSKRPKPSDTFRMEIEEGINQTQVKWTRPAAVVVVVFSG